MPPVQESVSNSILPAVPSDAVAEGDFTLATVIAGVLSFLIAAAWIGTWVWLRQKRA